MLPRPSCGALHECRWLGLDRFVFQKTAQVIGQIRGEVTDSDDGYLEMSGDDFALVYAGEKIIRFVVATDSDIGRLFIEEINS